MAVVYSAGCLATMAVSYLSGLTEPRYRRLPLSCHLLLGVLWPLWAVVLGVCVGAAAWHRVR